MPEQTHSPKDVRTHHLGADSDTEPELLKDGFALDFLNMRPTKQGDTGADKKILGESLIYPNIDNRCSIGTGVPLTLSYKCMRKVNVNGHIVEFWADELAVQPSYVRVDGQIVLMSSRFPITQAHPLQIDTDESCVGGDVFFTDFNVPPMVLNVEDLMSNSGMLPNTACTTKYFADFNPDLYVLQLSFQVDHPVFVQLSASASGNMIAIGSGAGAQEVGCYQYAIQLEDSTGNQTRLSPFTPLITVPKTLSSDSNEHTHSMSQGGSGGTATAFGIHFRVRLTNINGYANMRIVRASYIGETPIGTIPLLEVIHSEPLSNHSVYDVLDFFDAGTVTPIDVITEEEEPDALGGIQAVKTLRYFNKRVHLMNILYADRSIDNLGFNQSPLGKEMYPVMKKLNKKGFSDPYHSTYDRSLMHGEKYGSGVFLWDQFGNKSFVKAVPNFTNYQTPSRREVMDADSQDQSFEGRVRAATIYGTNTAGKNKVDDTFEVFDHYDAVDKNLCEFSDGNSFKNIVDDNPGAGLCVGLAASRRTSVVENYCSPVDGSLDTNCAGIHKVFSHNVGYQPFTPTAKNNDVKGHRYIVNPSVIDPIVSGAEITYNPKCFGLNHYSLGMALEGLNNIPSWASGFSVVRTEPANRVVMQGIGFYRLVSGQGTGNAMQKDTNAFCFYSPDSDVNQGLVSSSVLADIVANPQLYQIEIQSSLGFFSEIYNTIEKFITATRSKGVDMMVYARILRDLVSSSEINPNESTLMGVSGSDGYNYVGFGKWRQQSQNSSSPFAYCNASGNNGLFDISTVHANFASLNGNDALGSFTNNSNGRGNFMVLETVQQIFQQSNTGSGSNNGSSFSNNNMRNWHEPVYIINIVKKNANVPNNNINSYIDTGTYVKTKSIIGVSDGNDPQNFLLVDERWEDCCPALIGTWANFTAMSALDRYLTIKDASGNEKKWLNVTYKSSPTRTTILTDIQNNGFYVASGVKIYGVYTHVTTFPNAISDAMDVKLVFTQFDTAFSKDFFIPQKGDVVRVDYDNTVPVRVFGGDAVSGESVFSPIDMKYNDNGNPDASQDTMGMDVGFPFNFFKTNPRYYIARNPNATTGKIADWTDCDAVMRPSRAAYIRQLCVMFTVTSRIHSPYFVQDTVTVNAGNPTNNLFFPSVNYIMRPNEWTPGQIGTNTYPNVWPGYFTDYPQEYNLWNYGGFRFLPLTNIDYSKSETIQSFSSKPATGFVARNYFCTRDAWSAERLINVQNDPNIRTFPALNFKDIEDRQGEIKYAYDALTNSGSNLYAICERGIALLLVDKKILQEVSGNQLATMATTNTNVVLQEIWLSKVIGMNDETWRSAAEWDNVLYFVNKNSAYRLSNNKIDDIGRQQYHKRLYNNFLSQMLPGYQTDMAAVYDTLHNEYWIEFRQHHRMLDGTGIGYLVLQDSNASAPYYAVPGDYLDVINAFPGLIIRLMKLLNKDITIINRSANSIMIQDFAGTNLGYMSPGQVKVYTGDALGAVTVTSGYKNEFRATVVFSQKNEFWFGRYDYDFDQFLSFDNKMYGMRDNETYELGKGFVIRNVPVRSELLGLCNAEEPRGKEFIRMRVNSDTMPSKIEFYSDMVQADAYTPICVLDTSANPYALKLRNGYEQYIPRKSAVPNLRVQGRKLFFRIIHERANEEFKIISTQVDYKPLR